MSGPRVLLITNPTRPEFGEVREQILPTIADLASEYHELGMDGPLSDRHLEATCAVVIGGDGTLISQARRLIDTGIPLAGINVGRLGFLAEFDAGTFMEQAAAVLAVEPPVYEHIVAEVTVLDTDDEVLRQDVAINDCTITAGWPHRIIEMDLTIDGVPGPAITGDGVIFSTPTGSTAYNISAGGPIVHRSVEAFVITPLAPQSLAFRPIVTCDTTELEVRLTRANEGTTMVIDGQMPIALEREHRVRVRRYPRKGRLITNPATGYWRILLDKLRWAAPPNYRDRGR